MPFQVQLSVGDLLDKAKLMHKLPSDYKLALVMGVSHVTLLSYRQGKTLPDARVIKLICDLSGDDPALMLAQVEAERAKTEEARNLWLEVVERLKSTLHAAVFAVVFGAAGWAGLPMGEAQAHAGNENFSSYTSWNVKDRQSKPLSGAITTPVASSCDSHHFGEAIAATQPQI